MISLHSRYKAILALLAIPQLVSAQQEVDPKSHQQFADNLTSLLYTNSNECSSALGVSMAFSLLYPGSTNEGISQIKDTFNYPTNNLQLVWQDTTNRLQTSASGECISEFNGVCNSYAPTIQIANSIWIHNQCDDSGLFCLHTLNSTYDNVVGEYAIQTDFEADESPMKVNEWVSNSTNGLMECCTLQIRARGIFFPKSQNKITNTTTHLNWPFATITIKALGIRSIYNQHTL